MVTDLNPYFVMAMDVAELVRDKQAAYGDSFGQSHRIIAVLYPDGIPAEKFTDALTIVRILDKLFRIATQKEAFGEDPWRDVTGYALLAAVREEKLRNPKKEDDTGNPTVE